MKFDKISIDELSAERKLFNFRKKNKDFKFLSFPTRSGVGSNAAIIHYKATQKTNRKLDKSIQYIDELVSNMRKKYTEEYELSKIALHLYDVFKELEGVSV